jgi:hypothetical protein
MPIDYNKVIENKTIDIKNKYSNDPQKNYENDNNNKGLKGPNHLKIIPSSGVIYKNSENKKEGDDIYKNKNGRMSYKEYILLRKKYMEKEDNNDQINSVQIIEEDKRQKIIKKKENKKEIRSKSKSDKIKNYEYKKFNYEKSDNEFINVKNEMKETKKLFETNLDEFGNEVLNENLFKYRKTEYKPMRKTFTGNFFQRKGSQQKDKNRETFYNFNNNTKINNNAYKSYYGGFKHTNINKNK